MSLKLWKIENNATFLISVFLMLFIIVLAFSSSVNAEFIKANITSGIQQEYPASDVVRGWINISLKNEPLDSQLSTNFNYSITLNNILQKNNLLSKLTCKSSLCNSTFLKMQLEEAGLQLPSDYGNYTLRIMLGSAEITSQNISVLIIPRINSLSPSILPAAMPANFVVYASPVANSTIVEYEWNFGDGISEKTGANTALHTYSAVGEYMLKITVKDSKGKTASREFTINAVSPAASANDTINEKKEYIKNISDAIALFPEWQREFISKQLNITAIDSQLDALRQEYNSATKTEQYTAIMKNLTLLKVPKKLSGIIASNIKFSVVPGSIDMSKLKNAGAGNYSANISNEYKDAIASWFALNVNSSFVLETISAEFDNKEILDIATKIKLKVKPKQQLKDVYLVVEKSPADIKFKDASGKDVNGGTAVIFSELAANAEKETEFIVAGGVAIGEIFDLIFISPKLSELNLDLQVEPCNSNRVCEKDKGETWKNCRSDCKPVGLIMLYIFLVLAGAFIAYIILQEWYKKYYESSLFKNKNDLYNLLAFIENANKQGLREDEIVRKLKEAKWSGEQIAYALKKYKGQRVGMWEIPIFRGMENKKIKEEIAKRTAQSMPPSSYNFKP